MLSLPYTLPRRLSSKIQDSLDQLNYMHANSLRLSNEVRKVLRYPADQLRRNMHRSLDRLGTRKHETSKIKTESDVARKYFGNLVRDSADLRRAVEDVDLDGPASQGGVVPGDGISSIGNAGSSLSLSPSSSSPSSPSHSPRHERGAILREVPEER